MNLFRKILVTALITIACLQAKSETVDSVQSVVKTEVGAKKVSVVPELVSQKTVHSIKNKVVSASYDTLRDCIAFCGAESIAFFNEICSLKQKLCMALGIVAICCYVSHKHKQKIENK